MTAAVETGLWNLDPAASTVAVRHKTFWGLLTVKGAFITVTGNGEVQPDGTATGTITLDVASLDTGNAKRDEHLRSADFFDAAAHPEITFSVESAELRDGDGAYVAGRLTVRGISRPTSFTGRLIGADDQSVTLDAQFTVDRNQFGISANQLGMMGGLTKIAATLRFTRTAAA